MSKIKIQLPINTWLKVEDFKSNELSIDYNELAPQYYIGYSPEWIDLDFNHEGTRECFPSDGGDNGWVSSKWLDYHDTYMNDNKSVPTHVFIPESPKNLK